MTLSDRDSLIIVDVQKDFLSGGSLAIPDGDKVIPVLNRYLDQFRFRDLLVYATRDWHPPDHCSFLEQGGSWPSHCVAGSEGAEFPESLDLPPDTVVISKATVAEKDAYSGFDGTDLAERLRSSGIRRVFIGGLATEYCVLNTVMDALKAGFRVFLLEDAVRAIDENPGDGERARETMQHSGALPILLELLSDVSV